MREKKIGGITDSFYCDQLVQKEWRDRRTSVDLGGAVGAAATEGKGFGART